MELYGLEMNEWSTRKENERFLFNVVMERLETWKMFFIFLDLKLTYLVWVNLMKKAA